MEAPPEHPEALQAVLRQEPTFEEAQARIQRRAQTDQWPEDLPVLATVRETRALRARLEALVHKRLRSLSRVSGTPSLVEALPRLEALVLKPMPLEPMAGEVRVLEGDSADARAMLTVFPVSFLGVLASAIFLMDAGVFVFLSLILASAIYTVAHSASSGSPTSGWCGSPSWASRCSSPCAPSSRTASGPPSSACV
ncbi:hypothetical protein JQX13_12880 [Archangium violaceum]|uniref:hypothetical protein n=1 Tax=Archangium violaceum TaxID=83451 RepID=UPI00193C7E83|nr:hypothetical protein [Archangium violaceum]QRK10880.1 hypothetical protein JQX13_12880 [Archangium violaceum]